MSPTLRKPSPRVTSAADSAGDRRGFADDGTGEREAGRNSAFGAVCPTEGDGICGLAEFGAGNSPAGGNVTSGVRTSWAGPGKVSCGSVRSSAEARPGRGAVSLGGRAGRSCATIGGVFKTVGANSAAGVSTIADCGAAASRAGVVPAAEPADRLPTNW